MTTLSLMYDVLRHANVKRLPLFKNKQGEPAHSQPDGSDWSLDRWFRAMVGEVGEYANLMKKIDRGDFGEPGEALVTCAQEIADELADIAIYLDILAFRHGIDLGEAIISKFNRVSDRVDCPIRIEYNPSTDLYEVKDITSIEPLTDPDDGIPF